MAKLGVGGEGAVRVPSAGAVGEGGVDIDTVEHVGEVGDLGDTPAGERSEGRGINVAEGSF